MAVLTRSTANSIVLMKIGATEQAADDVHLTIGRGSGTKSSFVGRAEVRIPAPDWPSHGRIVKAYLVVTQSGTTSHEQWRGGSPRLYVYRMTERAKFDVPASADGHGDDRYSASGSGDKFPGGAVDEDSPVTFAVTAGKTTKDVTTMVEQMLPATIERRDGSDGGAELFGYFQLRSTDEDSASRSSVLSRTVSLVIEIDTRIVPGTPTILEVIGAVEDSPEPTLVATTTGTVLEVRFGFAAGPRETCQYVILELYGPGALDPPPLGDGPLGTRIRTSGKVAPLPGGGTGIYIARLTGLAVGVEGRFRLTAISSSGKPSPSTSVEDSVAHIQTAVLPTAPVNVKVTPYVTDLHVTATMSGPGHVTQAEVVVTRIPQGTLVVDDLSTIGGTTRNVDIDLGDRTDIAPDQRVSVVVRLMNENGIWSPYSAPVQQTLRAIDTSLPVLTPAPGRLLDVTPTFTITGPLFDGWRAQAIHETDDSIILYSTGDNVVVDQTTVNFTIPAGKLAYGQKFRVKVATVPNGGGTTYGDWTEPQPYSIASLPTSRLSVPDAIDGVVDTQTPTWRRTITDPDGADIVHTVLSLTVADDPQGTGTFLTRLVNAPGEGDVVIPGLTIGWETSVDARLWARNDITALVGTQLNGGISAGATSATLDTTSGMTVGGRLVIYSATGNLSEERTILTLPGGNVVTFAALEHAHLDNETVAQYAAGPFSPFVTLLVAQPPDVDLLTPSDGATVTRPWETLDWAVTGYGGRQQASATVTITDADGLVSERDLTTETELAIPAYLLGDAHDYSWSVTVVDDLGLSSTSATRTFTTSFTEPAAPLGVTAEPAPDVSAVLVSWDLEEDANLHHVEVVWFDDANEPVRIDGGPEGLDDGRTPFTGRSLIHIGARLGTNSYAVSAHNGWRSGESVAATTTLGWSDLRRGSWEIVRADATTLPLRVSDAPIVATFTVDPQQPPGGISTAVSWGMEARHISMRLDTIPGEDRALATSLRLLGADPIRGRTVSPVWVKPPPGYLLDPVWMIVTTFPTTPAAGGMIELSPEWLEVGDPVHAILAIAPTPPSGIPDIYASDGSLDFGVVQTEEPV